jgi:hypothetical protein
MEDRGSAEPGGRAEIPVGVHTIAFVPPDVFIIRYGGDVTIDEVGVMCDGIDKLVAGKPRLFAMIEQGETGKLASMEARKILLSRMPPATVGVVFVNVSTFARIGISLGAKAYTMMNRGREMPHAFVASAVEGLAWIAEQRKRLPT